MTSARERRAAGSRPAGRTVRQLLGLVLVTGVVAMLVVGAVGSLAVHESTETVDLLSRELSPAQVANAEFMEDMLNAETELRAYLIADESNQLADHRAALGRARAAEAQLMRYGRTHPEIRTLVQRQAQLAEAWVNVFVVRAVAEGPGKADADRALFDVGVRHFDAVRNNNQQIAKRFADQVAAARANTQRTLDSTLGLIALIGLLGAVTCGLVGWWAIRSIRRPLTALEDVVDHLAAGELDTRAAEEGPTEIRRLARAVNTLAEENARSRAMEQEVTDRLLDADRVKSEFVSNVSHELRTPLTSIDGYLELLSDDLFDDLDQEHAEMMTVMQRNVARLRTLIEDLLDLGRLERQPDELESVDVARVVRTVAEDLRLSAGSRDVTITVEVPAHSALVRGDPAQLQRAVTNLLSNAVKFSHDGGEVHVRLEVSAGRAQVTVTDDGIGIPEADLRKLGDRFFRASNAVEAHIPGTGLGLRMVQSIVTNHHGFFSLTSREGAGTTATVRLALEQTAEAARRSRGTGPADAASGAITGSTTGSSNGPTTGPSREAAPQPYPGLAPRARDASD